MRTTLVEAYNEKKNAILLECEIQPKTRIKLNSTSLLQQQQ